MMLKYVWFACLLGFLGQACSFTQKVQTGMQAYEVKQYAVATQLFEKEFNESRSEQDRAKLAFYAGESYSMLSDPSSAADWYFKAHQNGFGPDALEHYADALKRQEKYDEAIRVYEDLLKTSPGNASYRSSITLCRQAIEWKKNSNTNYEIVPASFNGSASDYSAQPIEAGKVLFTSDRETKQNTDPYLWTGRSFSDLYVCNTFTQQVTPFDPRINSPENEGTAIISPDGTMLIFTRCFVDDVYDAWCKLMISKRKGNEWSEPEPFPYTEEKVNYGQPAFTANGTTLFFSSDAPDGQGAHDLYFTQLDEQGQWSEPINLGPAINTLGEEEYPTVYKDTLYYSSDHLAGLGGLDIFKTYLDKNNSWVPPINLRSPINSGEDDFGFVVDTFTTLHDGELMKGYFTSSRAGAAHHDDIFSFTLKGIRPSDVVSTEPKEDVPVVKNIDYQIFLALRVVEPEFETKDDPNSKRIGKHALPNGPVISTVGSAEQRYTTNEEGQLLIKLEWDKAYTFTAKYRDHLAASYTLNTAEVVKNETNPITTISEVLELDPIYKNMEIELENIFYDYDQWAIRDDAKPSLDRLANILKSNPTIRIQLTSHTDCRGTDEYNLDLSQKRAQAAIEYLISVGIASTRLVPVGMGETNLAVNCICEQCTEEQHQANRRTTFKIID